MKTSIPELLVVLEKQEIAKHKTMSPTVITLQKGVRMVPSLKKPFAKGLNPYGQNPPMKVKSTHQKPVARCRNLARVQEGILKLAEECLNPLWDTLFLKKPNAKSVMLIAAENGAMKPANNVKT